MSKLLKYAILTVGAGIVLCCGLYAAIAVLSPSPSSSQIPTLASTVVVEATAASAPQLLSECVEQWVEYVDDMDTFLALYLVSMERAGRELSSGSSTADQESTRHRQLVNNFENDIAPLTSQHPICARVAASHERSLVRGIDLIQSTYDSAAGPSGSYSKSTLDRGADQIIEFLDIYNEAKEELEPHLP